MLQTSPVEPDQKGQFFEVTPEIQCRLNDLADAEREEKAEQDRRNFNFVQFERDGLLVLSQLPNAFAVQVFLYMSREMAADGAAAIVISQETLAEIFSVRRETINVAIKALTDEKLLFVERSGASRIYCLNADVAWNTSRDRKNLARFRAVVVLSKRDKEVITKSIVVRKSRITHVTHTEVRKKSKVAVTVDASNLK